MSRQRAELEKLQRQLEDNHRIALESMREDFIKAREEQERRHAVELLSFDVFCCCSFKYFKMYGFSIMFDALVSLVTGS